jgi:hypothetical protein
MFVRSLCSSSSATAMARRSSMLKNQYPFPTYNWIGRQLVPRRTRPKQLEIDDYCRDLLDIYSSTHTNYTGAATRRQPALQLFPIPCTEREALHIRLARRTLACRDSYLLNGLSDIGASFICSSSTGKATNDRCFEDKFQEMGRNNQLSRRFQGNQ